MEISETKLNEVLFSNDTLSTVRKHLTLKGNPRALTICHSGPASWACPQLERINSVEMRELLIDLFHNGHQI